MNFKKDITVYGVINIAIYFLLLIVVHYLLHFKSVIFDGFQWVHYAIWYGSILIQIIYTGIVLNNPDEYAQSRMGKNIYNLFTTGGYKSIKDVLIHSEQEPLFEYFLLLFFIMIPWPVFKKITMKHRFILLLSKIGLFHLVTSFILIDWETFRVDLKYNLE